MQKTLNLAPLFFLLFLFSCNSNRPVYQSPKSKIIDSFTIEGLQNGLQDITHLSYLNDSMFYTLGEAENELLLFKNNKENRRIFKLYKKVKLPERGLGAISFLLPQKKKRGWWFYFFDKEDCQLEVCNEAGRLIFKHKVEYSFPYLKKQFVLTGEALAPARLSGDTLIVCLSNTNASQILDYFKEKIFAEFLFNKDTLRFLRQLGVRPEGSQNYYLDIPYYCWQGEKAWTIYASFDTLFSYNALNGERSSFPINNLDFTPSVRFSYTETKSTDFSKTIGYSVQNFRYFTIATNRNTNHFILFYQKGVKVKADESKLPNPEAPDLYAIVVNDKGKIINYYYFGQKEYRPEAISIPRGVAILKYSNKVFDAKILQFDIFSF